MSPKYRIIKGRDGVYYIERKKLLKLWDLIEVRPDYERAVQVVEREQAMDAEGLPKVVFKTK